MNLLNAGVDSAKHDMQELVEALQAERATALTGLRDLQLATRLLVQAEAQRLARRNPADPRLAPLVAAERLSRERLAVLDTEIEVATIRVPPVKKTEALVHGRITDTAQRAAGRVTVALVAADGRPLDGVAPVTVDDAGYYAFVIPPEAAKAIGPDTRLGVAVQNGEAQVLPKAAVGFTLGGGSVAVKDVALDEDALATLKLRHPAFTTAAAPAPAPPVRTAAKTPTPAAAATPSTAAKASRAAAATPAPEPAPAPAPASKTRKAAKPKPPPEGS